MKSLSSVGLGLSIVFGCLLLALVAELYYLLWWKRRFTNRRVTGTGGRDNLSSPAKEFFYMFCLKKPSSSSQNQDLCSSVRITDALVNHEQQIQDDSSDAIEATEVISLSGPPRFLFTIVEETKEDLESEEAVRSRGRSLSDLLLSLETPYLTPFTSPPFFTPPLTPTTDSNHLLETSKEAEFNKIRSSPPPRFKFLQDAEEKLYRRRNIIKRVSRNQEMASTDHQDEEPRDGSFITITVDKYSIEREVSNSSSKVLPLPCSTSSMLKTQKTAAKERQSSGLLP
ncbi:hypothetical protein LINPERPRIM_LOCUS9638 [Linum perenne]